MKNNRIQIPKRERFWSKVDLWFGITDEDCWNWIGPKHSFGYGCFYPGEGKSVSSVGAHRFAYSEYRGEIPAGMVVRHKCDNPMCVNPSHLELGTHRDNNADMVSRGRHRNSIKTHCKWGHEFTEANTRKTITLNGSVGRYCKKCESIRYQRYKMARCDSSIETLAMFK